MGDSNKAFCRLVAETFDGPGPVFEVGSYQVEGQEGYANLRHLFPGQDDVGCDMRPGPGMDRVEDVTSLRAGSSTRKPRRPRGSIPPMLSGHFARFGVIDRSSQGCRCALRCRRTEASASPLARVGVVGPTRASGEKGAWPGRPTPAVSHSCMPIQTQ